MRPLFLATILATIVVFLARLSAAVGPQSAHQQTCLNKLNTDGVAVAKEQGKASLACLKSAGSGKLVGTAQSCLTADAKGHIAKKTTKTTADAAKSCATPPDFGSTSAATINDAAAQAKLDLIADIFGAGLDAAVLSCAPKKTGCRCQQTVLGAVEKLADTTLAQFVKCKKTALKSGAASATALSACVGDAGTAGSIAADTKGKIQKTADKLNADIVKSCDTPGITGAFPGRCTGRVGGALGDCLDVQVECRVCQMINEADGLFVNCDLFDDQIANASCLSGTGPTSTPTPALTSTPTPTLTPTPTATPTCGPGPVFHGALPATVGRFNYNLTLGLPGANAACNSSFAGSHVCSYFELQCAETAGSLVGAMDTGAMAVTSFWAVDSSQSPLTQCVDDVGSNQNWEYATAHTASRGQKLSLDNALGILGPLQAGVQCNFSGNSAVGCCL
jgi:hypothetical protein